MEYPYISIIVPVYNVAHNLKQCLESILSQTYTNWECILVNDGSTDGSLKICQDYAIRDVRFRVFTKENGGVSSARNLGIDKIKGEWVFFSDADDILEIDCLQILVDGSLSGCKLVIGGFNVLTEHGETKESCKLDIVKELNKDQVLIELYQPSDFSYQGYLWNKLYFTKIIVENGLRFNEDISFNEDGLFVLQYVCRLEGKIFYTTKPVYNYIERSSSAMGSIRGHFNPKFVTHFNSVLLQKEEVFKYTKNHKIRRLAKRRIVRLFIYILKLMVDYNAFDSDLHKQMVSGLFRSGAFPFYLTEYIKCLIIPVKKIIELTLLLISPSFLIKLKNRMH